MTPLPTNPIVVVLTDENNVITRIATNVGLETKVVVTNNKESFEDESIGKPFNFTPAD